MELGTLLSQSQFTNVREALKAKPFSFEGESCWMSVITPHQRETQRPVYLKVLLNSGSSETGEGGAVANPLSTHTLFHTNMQQNWTGGLQAGSEKPH